MVVVRVSWTLVFVAGCGGGSGGPSVDADALPCGAGTHEEGGSCVLDPAAGYDIRTSPMIRADGFTRVDVTVVGTEADGSPSDERIVFRRDRTSAGTFVSPTAFLGDRGAATTFLPCNFNTPGCVGPARLSIALASAPTVPVAHVDVMLVAPDPVGSIAPCMIGGNVLHYEAQDFGFTGVRTISTNGVFDVFGAPWRGRVQVTEGNDAFSFEVNTQTLDIPLFASVFENGRPVGRAGPYEPVLDSGFYPAGAIGKFQVHAFTYDPAIGDVTQITASFVQQLETDPTRKITGCVHYSQ